MEANATADDLVDLRFDTIEVGMEFGPQPITVTDSLVAEFAFTTEDYGALCDRSAPCPPAVLVPDLVRLINTVFNPSTMVGLHQREEFTLSSPTRRGEQVTFHGRCVEKYVRRGRGYYVIEADARSVEDGRTIIRHRSTEIPESAKTFADTEQPDTVKPGRRVEGYVNPDLAPVEQASADLERGTPVVPLKKCPSQAQIAVFSNAGKHWKSIHTDLESARAGGYRTTLAQGLMQSMYMSQLGARFFGDSWSTSGSVNSVYLAPVYEGDELTLHATVSDRSITDGETSIELETWVENQEGARTAAGWLRALSA